MNLDIRCGSSLHMGLPDESIQCVVTSPPYWGLRKYDGEQELVWGGNPECGHEWANESISREVFQTRATGRGSETTKIHRESYTRGTCLKCGAWCGAYGLEPTPELYVEHTVMFLREIRRVLREDGVVFWNVGDSFASGKGSCFNPGGGENSLGQARKGEGAHPLHRGNVSDLHASGLKPKDLVLIPFRVALAAQADGWWIRSDIIWAKPNPMPESVKDRPTSSYEHIFMLTKSQRYFWDIDAVREPMAPESAARYEYAFGGPANEYLKASGQKGNPVIGTRIPTNGRNIRDVWTIATQPSGFKHYAAFPEEIPTRCIKAASRPGDLVLDPFCGTGRTLYAALKLGRNAIGYDLSEKYCEMARERCSETQVEMIGGRY